MRHCTIAASGPDVMSGRHLKNQIYGCVYTLLNNNNHDTLVFCHEVSRVAFGAPRVRLREGAYHWGGKKKNPMIVGTSMFCHGRNYNYRNNGQCE